MPDDSYPFTFDLTSAYGVELIKIIASTIQFEPAEEAFSETGIKEKPGS